MNKYTIKSSDKKFQCALINFVHNYGHVEPNSTVFCFGSVSQPNNELQEENEKLRYFIGQVKSTCELFNGRNIPVDWVKDLGERAKEILDKSDNKS